MTLSNFDACFLFHCCWAACFPNRHRAERRGGGFAALRPSRRGLASISTSPTRSRARWHRFRRGGFWRRADGFRVVQGVEKGARRLRLSARMTACTATLDGGGNARPLFILDYGNNICDDQGPPRSARCAIAAFARFAAAAAVGTISRARPSIWEIWNEPNGDGFWPPHAPIASEYAANGARSRSQSHTYRRPESDTLIAPGVRQASRGSIWKPSFKSGLLQYLDGVSRPSRIASGAPESAAAGLGASARTDRALRAPRTSDRCR